MATLQQDITVAAKPGELVDALVWRILGKAAGAIEAVLEANPGLAGFGHVLEAGQLVLIPAIADRPVQSDLVQLWD